MTLFMATSTDYQVQDISEDTYILSDTDCVDTELATISQQDFNETNNLISTKEISNTTAHMGFSFSGTWDFLVSRFSSWFSEDEKEEAQKSSLGLQDCGNPTVGAAQPTCAGAPGCLGGNAFEDVNCNGLDDTDEVGVGGVQVVVYDCNNIASDTLLTDSDGDWQLCGLTDGEAYRVEFILPESIACWATPTQMMCGKVAVVIKQPMRQLGV